MHCMFRVLEVFKLFIGRQRLRHRYFSASVPPENTSICRRDNFELDTCEHIELKKSLPVTVKVLVGMVEHFLEFSFY